MNGNYPQGVKLDAIRLSTQVWRFRPIDMARVEQELWA